VCCEQNTKPKTKRLLTQCWLEQDALQEVTWEDAKPGRHTLRRSDDRHHIDNVGTSSVWVIGFDHSDFREPGGFNRRNTLISEVYDVATEDWSKKASDVPEGARRRCNVSSGA
jgi:hypothetical protein